MIAVNSSAPDFTLCRIGESGPELVSLSALQERGPVVILFFPMAFTGGCTKEMCEISQGLDQFSALNAQVVGISGDNPFAQKAWADKEDIHVQLLSDYEHKVAAAYDVTYDSFIPEKNLIMGGVSKRSAFIVDGNGVVQYAESSDNPNQMPNFEALKARLAELA